MKLVSMNELMSLWRLNEDGAERTRKNRNILKRYLNPNSSKRSCPQYFNPKHVVKVGDEIRFKYDFETSKPQLLRKP